MLKSGKFLFLLGIVFLCASCDKDPVDATDGIDSYLSGLYESKEGTDLLLHLTYNGEDITDSKVYFKSKDYQVATMTFDNVIPLESHTVIENISLTQDPDDDYSYSFEGSYTTKSSGIVDYSGYVKGKELLYGGFDLFLNLRSR
ncbi:hypothetical protein Barb7_00040 [Bacteroidales bacterium Barb7]|nr:hypothetical protein Barb7_00059 [Bacteroidales bacterium Barb7]OAV76294.1 hypothetical protein Barb7_00008 [Bacteroidales bacterium Barb7]OAV76326.1 hypothetical protein Barb7_00040 [Bacteroidales bacterium Barb7]